MTDEALESGFQDRTEEMEPESAGRDDLAWPPWLEGLSDRERIHAIVTAVARCIGDHGHKVASDLPVQHCTLSMAEHFLAKLLPVSSAGTPPEGLGGADEGAREPFVAGSGERDVQEFAAVRTAPDQVTVSRADLRAYLRRTECGDPNLRGLWETLALAAGLGS